ncbi:putative SH2 domain-containing protein 3C-like [Scophthalmus maximus]|uniref:Putative SH2 domain-containing protein 3C-like n=1 Tax=Scophthalmus maximus TaxID=52904 RepID=A0A2U9CEW4_SCOMX|nr:putative SH2 domain-containing protein 3C-like [Scophthalmus maximus]
MSSKGLKWFGSLTNLSFRRSGDKPDSKSSQSKSGCEPGDGGDRATDSTKILAPVVETTVDDLDGMRPRTASYVRSSESYTHMGTLPRLLRMKRDKKGGPSSCKKSKDKDRMSRSQSQRPLGFKDRDPPRFKAVSSQADGAAVKAETGPNQDSLTDVQAQPEPSSEINATNTQTIVSAPTAVCKDVAPSGGSSATLQPLDPEETSSPPINRGDEQTETHEDDGTASSHDVETMRVTWSRELTDGAREGDQSSINSHMEPSESHAEYVQRIRAFRHFRFGTTLPTW